MNIQSPQFVTDLYSDLRDRRLLPLIVVLLAGMVVVPIALSSSPKNGATPAAAAPATPAASKSPLLNQAVTLSDPGIRKYQSRLSGDASVDPFLPRVQGVAKSGNSNSSSGGLTSTSTSSGSSGGSSSGADVPLTAEGQAAAAAANGSSPSTSVPSGGSSGSARSGQSASQSSKIVFYRLKIRSGLVGGEMAVNDEVGPSTALPSKSVPALAFLGVTFDGNLKAQQAYFLVSNGVSLITGSGQCSFGAPCQLVAMKPGDYVDLTWTDGQQYRVKLLAFERHTRDNPGNSGALTSSPSAQTGSDSGQSPAGRHRASHHFSF